MYIFLEQKLYVMIVVFLQNYIGRGLSYTKPTLFPTKPHDFTSRHPAFLSFEPSTYHPLVNVKELSNVAHFGDAEHRGPAWYDYRSHSEDSDNNDGIESSSTESTSSSSSSLESSESSEASSFETKERHMATRVYRTCTPCPQDMLKRYKNHGIKWICAAYQRARRTFKSECMMRYRNCQDGTLFVKIHDQSCVDDPFHGRHFFYHYSQ